LGGREQKNGGVQPVRDRAIGQARHRRVGDHALPSGARQQMGVAIQVEEEHHRPTGLGDRT
jgi:hypothetical protein